VREASVTITSTEVEEAWQAFRATQLAIKANPALRDNEYFLIMQDGAYTRFVAALEAMEITE
jgi:hypothetical protein